MVEIADEKGVEVGRGVEKELEKGGEWADGDRIGNRIGQRQVSLRE